MTGALRRIGWAVLTAVLVATGAVAETCREDAVLLRGDWGQARFGVEVADTGGERARGLMHRENLPKSRGMLFVYHKVGYVAFWMKNTLIPLDMIFLDETGTVVKVHHEAQPLDPTVIPGGDNVKAVLEINGGLARDMGIAEGSEMRHPSFGKAAAWPCD
ncbi:DUF192 domain-containing protein [Marimonas lutisalis]|uniref:DUF192 domain-containing protein n=1 Tax=Marimonas lutisalis TaxID=2545756 RepID=UPI0010F5F562|nr:DUF192 domain-containing protein [Marimonas lutisalis]